LKVKIGLILFGFTLSFLIIEGGLRLAGSLYILAHDKSYFYKGLETEPWDRDETFEVYERNSEKLIVAIGDSFTNGGNVQSHQSYPSQLFELEKRSSVVNLGRCESSAYSAYLRLKNFYETNSKRPKFVTILVGAADGFVEKPESEAKDTFVNISSSSWVFELRTYKLIRYISLGLKRNRLIGNIGKAWDLEKEISIASKVKSIMQNAYLDKKDLNQEWSKAHQLLSLDFLNYCERNKIYVDNPRGLLHASLIYLVRLYTSKGDHGKALETLLNFQSQHPKLFWSDFFQPARFFFYQIFQIQSRYSSNSVLENFQKQLEIEPSIRENNHFQYMLKRFENWDSQESKISVKRKKYLGEMIKLARNFGTTPILMTYPSEYEAANRDIVDVAKMNKVSLVDLRRFFDKNSKDSGRVRFFEDDDHLTPYGYKLMAKEVSALMRTLE